MVSSDARHSQGISPLPVVPKSHLTVHDLAVEGACSEIELQATRAHIDGGERLAISRWITHMSTQFLHGLGSSQRKIASVPALH